MPKLKTAVIILQGAAMEIDENASLYDMRVAEPHFFSRKFGKRETYHVHRGCLICRHTVEFTGRKPQRMTVGYLFGYFRPENKYSTFHIESNAYSLDAMKAEIDAILDRGYRKNSDLR